MKKQLKCYLLSKSNQTLLHVQPIDSKTNAVLACQEAFEMGYRINKAYYCVGSISFDLKLPDYFRQISPKVESIVKISLLQEWVKEGLPKEEYFQILNRMGMFRTPIGL